MKLDLAIVALAAVSLSAAQPVPSDFREIPRVGLVTLLNPGNKKPDWSCLADRAGRLTAAVDAKRIVEYKTVLDPNHAMVKEFLREPGIRIARREGRQNMIVPFKHRGKRFLLYRGGDYRLVGMAGNASLDFSGCLGAAR